jgi:hypothetical protein
MVRFQTKNPNLGKFWRVLDVENVAIFYGYWEYFTNICDILWQFGTFCDHLVDFFIVHQEKSGNPAGNGIEKRNRHRRLRLFATLQFLFAEEEVCLKYDTLNNLWMKQAWVIDILNEYKP